MSDRLRRMLYAASGVLVGIGLLAVYIIVRLILIDYYPNYHIVSSRDLIYLVLWGVVALCFVAIGINLFQAARSRLIYDVVPGPTLYLLGATLVVIGMFLASSGVLLVGAVLASVGLLAMWLEYKSTFI